jgi:hypothetical protein
MVLALHPLVLLAAALSSGLRECLLITSPPFVVNVAVQMARLLVTHWKECDKERWDIPQGAMSTEARVFKTNPNARDLKGWNCAAIAVFHNAKVRGGRPDLAACVLSPGSCLFLWSLPCLCIQGYGTSDVFVCAN